MEVCLAIGVQHPSRLAESLTWPELLDWVALWRLSPWGEFRKDLRSGAQVLSMLMPYLPDGVQFPGVFFPYFNETSVDAIGIDVEASIHFFKSYKAQVYGQANIEAVDSDQRDDNGASTRDHESKGTAGAIRV